MSNADEAYVLDMVDPYADTYAHDGASLLYARAARTRLLRAVRTGGLGRLVLHGNVHRTRIRLGFAVRTTYRGTTGCGATAAG